MTDRDQGAAAAFAGPPTDIGYAATTLTVLLH